jgi:hypothetical protein
MAIAAPGPTPNPGRPDGQALTPSQLMPRRNPGLVRRIAELVLRAVPQTGPQPEDQNTTQTGIVSEGLVSLYDRQFKFDVTRRATYKDVEEIDQASEEASIALDTITNNVTTSDDGVQMSFQVFSRNPKVMEVIEKVVTTCKLHQSVRAMVRNLIKYGDMFAEVVINLRGEVVAVKQLPPITMFRNEDLTGNLLLGEPRYDKESGKVKNGSEECAFEQKAEATGQMLATFWPWQIIHMRLNHDGFSPYGKSHLRVARITYKKLKALEESLIVGRLTRDILKLVFYVDTTGLSPDQRRRALQDFQFSVMQRMHVDGRRENPFSVMTDFFVSSGWIKMGQQVQPMQTKVDIIDPKNVGIHDITDIEYLHRKFTAALRVPRAHLGFEKDVNSKSTLTIQDVQYVRFLRDIQQVVGHGLEQLFDTALILADIDPESEEYVISWPALSAVDQMNAAQSELWRAQSHAIYANPPFDSIDGRWVQQHIFNMSDEEMDEVDTRVAAYKATQDQMQLQKQQAMASIAPTPGPPAPGKPVKPKGAISTAGKAPKDQGQGKALPNPTGYKRKTSDKSTQSRYTAHNIGDIDVPPMPGSVSSEYKQAALVQALYETTDELDKNLLRLSDKLQDTNGHDNGHNSSS